MSTEDASTNQPHQSSSSNDPKTTTTKKKKRLIFDKSLGTAAGLSKLLPTGTTLAFQTMAPSFTKGGTCLDHDVNFAFTCGLIIFLTLLCAVLSFTDSITGKDGKTHYGVATFKGFRLFEGHGDHARRDSTVVSMADLRRRRLKRRDYLHAVVSAGVFLALAFCDAGVQECLVKKESQPWKDFFNNLPLAVGFLATFVFIVFPSTRKGIGHDNGAWIVDDDGHGGSTTAAEDKHDTNNTTTTKDERTTAADGSTTTKVTEGVKTTKNWQGQRKTTTALLGSAASLSKLLPTGTTLAFQTMAPSFTNGGDCNGHRVNFAFTWGLISCLTLISAAVCFTDSVTDLDGHTYYGVATGSGFRLFNHDPKELRLSEDHDPMKDGIKWQHLKKEKKIKARDFLHAVLSAAVFVASSFCDAGVQSCLIPEESTQWKDFLNLLPLAVAFLASFLFVIFPSRRKGIGEEGAYWDAVEPTEQPAAKKDETSLQVQAMAVTGVAPSSEGRHDAQHAQLHLHSSAV